MRWMITLDGNVDDISGWLYRGCLWMDENECTSIWMDENEWTSIWMSDNVVAKIDIRILNKEYFCKVYFAKEMYDFNS